MMKSLFAKILAWFLFATLLTGLVTVAVHAISHGGWPPERVIQSALRPHVDAAATALRTNGKGGLTHYLHTFHELTGSSLRLIDSDGFDVETGERIGEIGHRPRFGPPPVVVESSDGSVRGVIQAHERFLLGILASPRTLVVFGLSALLCWALARHISRPIDDLRHAVDRFGAGETRLRVDTERKDEVGDLARSFDRMAGRIDSLLTNQRQLLLDISHELRSPLTRLSLATDLLRNDPSDKQCLAQIETESQRLNALISEVLLAGRLEADPTSIRSEPVHLDQLLREIVESVDLEARSAGRRIEMGDLAPVEITADAELLRRAIENVVRNAIRHTPEGDRVTIELAASGSTVQLAIRDFGPGVASDALPRLFEPFYRVDDARNQAHGGAGLGLTIARRAIEAHGGTIEARNADPGLEVTIALDA